MVNLCILSNVWMTVNRGNFTSTVIYKKMVSKFILKLCKQYLIVDISFTVILIAVCFLKSDIILVIESFFMLPQIIKNARLKKTK